MEHIKKEQYEKLKLEISYFSEQDVLTTSQGSGAGDCWVEDPFTQD